MNNPLATQLFQEQFKYEINAELRHRGDNKSLNSDMGLFVLRRIIEETKDDTGTLTYSRCYICRMIRFSGSGDIAHFMESELISIPEYEKHNFEREQERKELREIMDDTMNEVYDSFGVKPKAKVYLVKDGVADTSVVYKVCGFHIKEKDSTILNLRKLAGQGSGDNETAKSEVEILSKSEIQPVP